MSDYDIILLVLSMAHKITKNEELKRLLGPIRSKVLQKLVILACYYLWDFPHNPNAQRLLKDKNLRPIVENVVSLIPIEEIMRILHVSKRTAVEYKHALSILAYMMSPL